MSEHKETTTSMTLTTPASAPGQVPAVVTGVNVQGMAGDLKILASQKYRNACKQTAQRLTTERKAAVEAKTAAQDAYEKTVADLTVPADFVKELRVLAVAFKSFYPDAVATDRNGVAFGTKARKKAAAADPNEEDEDDQPTAGATPGIKVLGTEYGVTGHVRSAGSVVTSVEKTYPLPAAVTAARRVLADAEAKIAQIDAALVEVRTALAKADEVGTAAVSTMIATQMAKTAEGKELLEAMNDMVDVISEQQGLDRFADPMVRVLGPAK